MFVCVLFPNFGVQLETHRNASVVSPPILLFRSLGSQRYVFDSSPRLPVIPFGTSLHEIFPVLTNATFLEADLSFYEKSNNQLLDILATLTPLIEDADLRGNVFTAP